MTSDSSRQFTFISYASENTDFALKIYDALKDRDVNAWIDKKDLGPGKFKTQIFKAISRSKYFIICISNAALKKTGEEPGFQDEELNYAYHIAQAQADKDFTIIPIRIEDCGRGDHRLSIWQQYDLFEDFDQNIDELAVHIGGVSLSDKESVDKRNEEEKMFDQLFGIAKSEFYAGAFQKSIDLCTALEVMGPKEEDVFFLKGNSFILINKLYDALAVYDKVIKINPSSAPAWSNKGGVLHTLNRKKEALAAYDKAIELNPKLANTWFNKGQVLYEFERKEEALAAYDKAIELNPKDFKVWHTRGDALHDLDRKEEALAAYDKALELNPESDVTWSNTGLLLYFLDRNEEALAAYDRAIELNSKSDTAWTNKGCVLHNLDRNEEALAAYDKALELNPKLAHTWSNKGLVLFEFDRKEEALAAHDRATGLSPNWSPGWFNRARYYSKTGKKDECSLI